MVACPHSASKDENRACTGGTFLRGRKKVSCKRTLTVLVLARRRFLSDCSVTPDGDLALTPPSFEMFEGNRLMRVCALWVRTCT